MDLDVEFAKEYLAEVKQANIDVSTMGYMRI
jgi:hypothetical protein